MSLYYTRGGFKAASRTLDLTGKTSVQMIKKHFITQLICLFEASRADASARGAAYTQYWDFDDTFFAYCANTFTNCVTYTANDLCENAFEVSELNALTSRRSGAIAVRANDDSRNTYPAYATVLKGQNRELLYICMCSGVTPAFTTDVNTSYGLPVYYKWLAGYGNVSGAAYVSGGGLHVWYNPNPSSGIYPFGSHHPGRSDFLAVLSDWLVDGGWSSRNATAIAPNASNSLTSVTKHQHVVICKEDVVMLCHKNPNGDLNPLVFGRKIVELKNGTGCAGMFALQYSTIDSTASLGGMAPTQMSSRPCGDIGSEVGLLTHAGATGANSYQNVHLGLFQTTMILCNRAAGKPLPFVPIAIHALPYVSPGTLNSTSLLSGDGTSLVGYLRGDIARATCGWQVNRFTTIDSGNYMILHGSSSGAYNETIWVSVMRLVIGWDSSNEVVL